MTVSAATEVPTFKYPAALRVKNTFLEFHFRQIVSPECYINARRRVRSAPGSIILGNKSDFAAIDDLSDTDENTEAPSTREITGYSETVESDEVSSTAAQMCLDAMPASSEASNPAKLVLRLSDILVRSESRDFTGATTSTDIDDASSAGAYECSVVNTERSLSPGRGTPQDEGDGSVPLRTGAPGNLAVAETAATGHAWMAPTQGLLLTPSSPVFLQQLPQTVLNCAPVLHSSWSPAGGDSEANASVITRQNPFGMPPEVKNNLPDANGKQSMSVSEFVQEKQGKPRIGRGGRSSAPASATPTAISTGNPVSAAGTSMGVSSAVMPNSVAATAPPPAVLRLDFRLSDAVPPTAGSTRHGVGECKPCAFVWKEAGCGNGASCPFCHLCDPQEKKRRTKERKKSWKDSSFAFRKPSR